MKEKIKEILKDNIIMFWSFVGSGVCFFFMINYDFHYLTGNYLKVSKFIYTSLFIFGFGIVGLLAFVLISKIIYLKVKKHFYLV